MTPLDLPPNLDLRFPDCSASVEYYIEAKLERPGVLKVDRKESIPFRVFRPDPVGSQLKQVLPTWDAHWITWKADDIIRKLPLFGPKCYTMAEVRPAPQPLYSLITKQTVLFHAQLDLPDVPVFPLHTPIPLRIRITTLSKKMRRDEWQESDNKPLFPTPPCNTRELSLKLHVVAFIRAGNRQRMDNTRVIDSGFGGLGLKDSQQPLIQLPKVWIPEHPHSNEEKIEQEGSEEGRWRQEAQCFTTIKLDCSPSFVLPNLAVRVCRFASIL